MPDISESSGIRNLFMTFGEVQEIIPLLSGEVGHGNALNQQSTRPLTSGWRYAVREQA